MDREGELVVDDVGPCGDKRRLSIKVAGGRIEVRNLSAPEGQNLQVSRPLYGYERFLVGPRDIHKEQPDGAAD